MRGYIDFGGSPVRWRGMSASYTVAERSLMRLMPVREQAIVHTLKSLTHGEIQESGGERTGSPDSETRVAAVDTQSRDAAPEKVPTPFIDPEDIAFGKPKKKRPVYALVWTWRRHKTVKTKALGTRKMRAWKKWHERQGWKVLSHSDGFFAMKGSEREVISLHEYDRETKERLK